MKHLDIEPLPAHLDVRRWLPPDVNFAGAAEPVALVAPSAEEIASIRETARRAGAEAGQREGYAAGYQEGREEAAREAEAERQEREARDEARRLAQEQQLTETVAALEALALTLADPLASTAESLEPELLALVEALARRVILAELETRPELIARVLHEALGHLPSRSQPLRVQVCPEQLAILETYAETRGERITWLPEPALEPGGCILETGPSRIDATLDTRLRQAVDAIWGEVARPEPAHLAETAPNGAEMEAPPRPEPHAGGDPEPRRALEAEPAAPMPETLSGPTADTQGAPRLDPESEPRAEPAASVQPAPREEDRT